MMASPRHRERLRLSIIFAARGLALQTALDLFRAEIRCGGRSVPAQMIGMKSASELVGSHLILKHVAPNAVPVGAGHRIATELEIVLPHPRNNLKRADSLIAGMIETRIQ